MDSEDNNNAYGDRFPEELGELLCKLESNDPDGVHSANLKKLLGESVYPGIEEHLYYMDAAELWWYAKRFHGVEEMALATEEAVLSFMILYYSILDEI